jgi:hypothetical protein
MNTASNTCLRLTTQVGQAHTATGVLLDLGTNSQPHRPENAAEHKTRATLTYTAQAGEHHRSDRSLLVKPGDFHRTALHRSGRCNTPVRRSQPKNPKTPNRPTELQTDPNSKQQQHRMTENSPNIQPSKTQQGSTPVRPVCPGLLEMNSTRGSTPPNPNLDLPNRSTDLRKTLGIVGTPHGEYIAKLLSTKTHQIKRNRRNPAKNSSNPRTPKTPKSSPFTH